MDYKQKAETANRLIRKFGNSKKYIFGYFEQYNDSDKPWNIESQQENFIEVFAVFVDNVKYYNKKQQCNMQSLTAYVSPKNIESVVSIKDNSVVTFDGNQYTIIQSEILKPDESTSVLITLRLVKYGS